MTLLDSLSLPPRSRVDKLFGNDEPAPAEDVLKHPYLTFSGGRIK